MMNDPSLEVAEEVKIAGELGFDFLDLTLEPPKARVVDIDVKKISSLLKSYNLQIIGHTSFYLQWASSSLNIYQGALSELEDNFRLLQKLGTDKVALHPHWFQPNSKPEEILQRNIDALKTIVKLGKNHSLKIMIENIPHGFMSYPETLKHLLDNVDNTYFLLDLTHCAEVAWRQGITPKEELVKFLKLFGKKIIHLHLSDIRKGDDHLPLGVGNLDWVALLNQLQEYGYRGTLTLEVFVKSRDYLKLSLKKLKESLK